MPTYTWLIIIAAVLLLFWLWSKYGPIIKAINAHPEAVHAGLAVDRYATDVQGLVGAYQAFEHNDGPFMSRLGAFFGTLPS
jgi:ABC-type glucose/galactose transport system permease subunit